MKLPLLVGICAALVLAGCNSPAPAPASDAVAAPEKPAASTEKLDFNTFVGKPIPAFEFVYADGSQHKSSDFTGEVVLLDFWASWCVTCKAASPTVQKMLNAYGEKGLRVIAVNTFEVADPKADKDDRIVKSAAASLKYAEEHKYTFDLATYGDATAERWGIGGVPVFILIGKDGTVLLSEDDAKPETLAKIETLIKKELGA